MPARARSEMAKKLLVLRDKEKQTKLAVAEYLAAQKKALPGVQKKGAAFFAQKYNVSPQSILNQAKGYQSIIDFNQSKQKMSPAQEEVLVNYILRSASFGFPLTHAQIWVAANSLVKIQGQEEIGTNWINRFLTRHNTHLQTHWSKHLDMQ